MASRLPEDAVAARKGQGGTRPGHHLRTGLLFCGLTVALYALCPVLARHGLLDFSSLLTAEAVAGLIRLSGLEAVVQAGNHIRLANAEWVVTIECTAIYTMIIYTAFLLVYPASLRAKGLGIAVGLPVIFLANLLRLLGMAWVEKLLPAQAGYFHDYFWQVVFLLGVAFMWLIWIDKVVNRANKSPVSA